MNKLRSVVGVLITCLLLTNLVTQNSIAFKASASTMKANARLESPPPEGGIAILNAPINPADVPVAESEISSTTETVWGWYYNKTATQINEMGKQSNLRPITLAPNGLAEATPRFHVLFVKNVGVYSVNDWKVVASRTTEDANQLDSPAFRTSGWRVAGLTWHQFKAGSQTENRLATILVNDNLYLDYDVRVFLTQAQLQALATPQQGFRVVDFDQFRNAQGQYQYAAVIVPNKGVHFKRWGWQFVATKSTIVNTAKKVNNRVFRVTDIERRDDGKYDALIVESNGEATNWFSNLTNDTIYKDLLPRHGSWSGGPNLHGGIRFIDMVAYKDEDNVTKFELLTLENGLGDYPIARDNVKEFKAIDDAFIRTMSRNGVPAASFALAKNGKVIYRAAYGYANLDPLKPATLNTRGRLASISKTFTAAAIMKLVEEGSLGLGDTVFGPNGILKNLKPFSYSGYQGNNVATLNQIKVEHLLAHTAGWDRGTSGDPNIPVDTDALSCNSAKTGTECEPTISMAQAIAQHARNEGSLAKNETRGASIDEVIRWMMRPDDADFLPRWAPGTRQVYSNVGYTVLQKIIEVKSGKSYADYIKQMTAQMGVTFAIGRSDPATPLPNEWTYYDSPGASTISGVYWSSKPLSTPVPRSYIYDMTTMLGHGGWVASPQELVKFASKMDSTAGNPWITWKTFRSMMNRPTGATNPSYYGFNWGVDPLGNEADDKFHFAHGGSLSGSKNLFLKGMYERKLSVAFLFNSSDAGGDLGVTLGKLIEGLDNKGVLGNLALSGTIKTQ